MVEIKPFKAVILNPELKNRAEMVCPVYDTIDASLYEKYSAKRNNVICFTTRKEGARENEFVDFAKQNLNRFFNECLLIEREKRSFYIYGVRYKLSEEIMEQIPEEDRRETYFAFGLVALVKVEKLNEDSILGHERTFEANTQERYRLMKECGMIFSPIVAEYNMPNHDINRIFEDYLGFRRPDLKIDEHRKPIVDVELNGARHLLWEVSDEEIMDKIQHLMKNKRILILDGHHRYTASHRLSIDKGKGTAYTLMTLLEGGDRALLLLPWHRCVKKCHMEDLWTKVKENFKIESYDRSMREHEMDSIYSKLRERESEREHGNEFDVRLGMYDGDKFYLLRADERKIRKLAEERGEQVGLDVISLHEWIIGEPEDIVFMSSLRDAIKKVDSGDCRVAFFLKPLRITDVEYKAQIEKKAFPQKSTLFLPKVAEGIVMCRNLL
ncbi:MAG: DUF1015 domain-containing protein [Methanophagales archaeon]|nr:DUF1015 domain-containing protein [Methanophagales archaeon]